MNKILGFAALAEAATGALVFLLPAKAARLLFGMEIAGCGHPDEPGAWHQSTGLGRRLLA
jgi:hypothetical protein